MDIKIKSRRVIEANFGIEPGGKAHAFFTAEYARQMDPFVPFDKGKLAETVIKDGRVTDNVTVDTITYKQPYALIVYKGKRKGKPIKIKTGKHHLATKEWDKHMVTAKRDDIMKALKNYVQMYGGK